MKHRGVFERPKNSRIFWVSFRGPDGVRHREKVGNNFAEAVQVYDERIRQVREGRYAPSSRSRPRNQITFAQIAMERTTQHLSEASRRTDEFRMKPLLEAFGSRAAAAITAQDIEKFMNDRQNAGNGKATANRYRSLLSSIFRYAVRNGRVAVNPVSQAVRFRESAGRVRFLSSTEEVSLRAQIRAVCPEREPEFDLALYTGMRRGEQFGLKRSGVDLANAILTVSGKTGQRKIILNSVARAAVQKLLARGSGEFVCGAKRLGQRDWQRWFEAAVKRAGIQDFHWHDLRHSFASRLVMAGVDIRSVQELMGHKSILMTMRYAHLSPAHQKANLEKLAS
jgi:site-specific recombinase XerD